MRMLAIAASFAVLTVIPAGAQTLGLTGTAQSPLEARQIDQKYDELKSQGKLDAPNDSINELKTGSDLVRQAKFAEAIPHLEAALDKHPGDVTTLIYLGYSHRMVGGVSFGTLRTGHFMSALTYYKRALVLDPKNRMLHEYTGKVRMLLHDVPGAQDNLRTLKQLCPAGCEELKALASEVPAVRD